MEKEGDRWIGHSRKNNSKNGAFLAIYWLNLEKKCVSRGGYPAELCRFYRGFPQISQMTQISSLVQAVLDGKDGGLGAVGNTQFCEDGADVVADGAFG